MTDTSTLVDICRTTAKELRSGERVYDYTRREADRLDHVVRWLDDREELPNDPKLWPCTLCEAEPLLPCFENRPDGYHYGRGFRISITQPGDDAELPPDANPGERCRPTVEVGPANAYRSRCLGCGHRSEPVRGENAATERAHDHAFPGWRELPIVLSPPHHDNAKKQAAVEAKWRADVARMLPDGWLDRAGPIRTLRGVHGTRHIPHRAPGGGYDMSAGVDPAAQRAYDAAVARREAARNSPLATPELEPESINVGQQYVLDFGV